jgi:hypothetical protein
MKTWFLGQLTEMDDRIHQCRVWLNPAGCKVITLPDALRKTLFARYDADPRQLPPSGVYQVQAGALTGGGNAWYAVDFAGLRGSVRSRDQISEAVAMRLSPLVDGGVGDIDVGGCALGRFAFALPTTLSETLAECIVGYMRGVQLGSMVTQHPTGGGGGVVRKNVPLTFFGAARARVAGEVRRWLADYALHPVADLLYMATCREWRRAAPLHAVLQLTVRKAVSKGRAAMSFSLVGDAVDVDAALLSGSALTFAVDHHTGEREAAMVSVARVYGVNGRTRLYVELMSPIRRAYDKGVTAELRAAVRYECVDAADVVRELQHEFMGKLLSNRVFVVRLGRVLTHTVDFATIVAVAVAFWTVRVVGHSLRETAVHQELHLHVPKQEPVASVGGGKTAKVRRPKCVQRAALQRDGPLKHGLRLDIASIEMRVRQASKQSLVTPRYMAQLVTVGNFRRERVTVLQRVIETDHKRRHKEFGVTSCSKRRQPNVSGKLRCPYGSTLECCKALGHTDLDEARKVYGFTPVDVALGYKLSRPLLFEADGQDFGGQQPPVLRYTHALASLKN